MWVSSAVPGHLRAHQLVHPRGADGVRIRHRSKGQGVARPLCAGVYSSEHENQGKEQPIHCHVPILPIIDAESVKSAYSSWQFTGNWTHPAHKCPLTALPRRYRVFCGRSLHRADSGHSPWQREPLFVPPLALATPLAHSSGRSSTSPTTGGGAKSCESATKRDSSKSLKSLAKTPEVGVPIDADRAPSDAKLPSMYQGVEPIRGEVPLRC